MKRPFLAGFLICLSVAGLSWMKKGKLPAVSDIRPELRASPVQSATDAKPFSFRYADGLYDVDPQAAYELTGLVVSHNNAAGFGDIYHDGTSIDTKDLCVIWGDNVERDDYQRVEFWSGSWTCHYRYPEGVTLMSNQIANNHLITDDAFVRNKIADVQVGDQIRLSGLLVNYREARHPDQWRKTSLTRDDVENGACEVVFVRNLEILKEGTHGWQRLFKTSLVLGGVFALAGVALPFFGL